MSRRQAVFWVLTIPFADWTAPDTLPDGLAWVRGQQEVGEGGYHHWQLFVAFTRKKSLAQVTAIFGARSHCEISRSEAAIAYVWKEETRVEGTQIELGARPIRRNSPLDWEAIWTSATTRDLDAIPANIRLTCYRTLSVIASDFEVALPRTTHSRVFWGNTGTGKSYRAWNEAGAAAYCKDPRSKFWCAYNGQPNVILDEFRGGIDIAHLLRWLDRYPCRVETKGGDRPLCAVNFWITSNIEPRFWYPDLDEGSTNALLRRLQITQMDDVFVPEE